MQSKMLDRNTNGHTRKHYKDGTYIIQCIMGNGHPFENCSVKS